jgi:hypothetical protein
MEGEKNQDNSVQILKIVNAVTVYEVLNINQHIIDDPEWEKKVKIKYRKLSLEVHPDKNSHPKASEAFAILNRAYNLVIKMRSNINLNQKPKIVKRSNDTNDFVNEWMQKMNKQRPTKNQTKTAPRSKEKFGSESKSNFSESHHKETVHSYSRVPCQAKTLYDEPCKKFTKMGEKYCFSHKNYDPNVKKPQKQPSVKCGSLKKDGQPCQKFAISGSQYCHIHKNDFTSI